MINIKNLTLKYLNSEDIIKNLNLEIKQGEIHVLMGKNGSGKSTILKAIAGDPEILKTGEIDFNGKSIIDKDVDEIANEGVFLSFQSPITIEGINNVQFIKQALNCKNIYNKESEVDIPSFLFELKENMKLLGFNENFLTRNLNDGFSGGERKKNELLQILMLKPDLILIDEIDSGVDIDGIKIISNTLNKFIKERNCSVLIVSHYEKVFEYIKPDKIHILNNGSIIKSGGIELIEKIHEKGFDYVINKI